MSHRTPRSRAAFSLVEMLVVIGIIVILLGILLPVISGVRKAAWKADSQKAISNLATVIEKYRMDFNAYPGPIPQAAFLAGRASNFDGVNYGGRTTTENLTIALLGGWDVTTPAAPTFSAGKLGGGPITYNPIISARKKYPAYASAVVGTDIPLRNASGGFDLYAPNASPPVSAMTDSDIPEFIDRYPDPLPLIYLRAKSGATGIVRADDGLQYNSNHLKPYERPVDFKFGAGEDFDSVQAYFHDPGDGNPTDPNTWTRPRQKDGYWLIGAGPDRRFGTKDDQTNFGPL